MPIQVMITPAEAEAATAAEVGTVRGRSFTYDPKETFALCEKINATGADGAQRLVTRMADIYGKNFIQAPSPVTEQKRVKRMKKPLVGKVYIHRDNDDPPAPPPLPVEDETGGDSLE